MADAQQNTEKENIIYVTEHRVACDGGGGASGHPKTYYELDHNGEAECLYCGQKFKAAHGHHH